MPAFTTEQLSKAGFLPESCFPVTFSKNNNNISSNHKMIRKPSAHLSLCNPLSVGSVSCPVVPDSATPWTAVHQACLSMRFPRQEYWSGLPKSPSAL